MGYSCHDLSGLTGTATDHAVELRLILLLEADHVRVDLHRILVNHGPHIRIDRHPHSLQHPLIRFEHLGLA